MVGVKGLRQNTAGRKGLADPRDTRTETLSDPTRLDRKGPGPRTRVGFLVVVPVLSSTRPDLAPDPCTETLSPESQAPGIPWWYKFLNGI